MADHKCEKETTIDDMRRDNDKMYKVIYGNGQPGLLSIISELSGNVKSLSSSMPELNNKIDSLMEFKAGEIALKNSKTESIKTWGMYIAIIVSIGIAVYNPAKRTEVVTDVQLLREAMREEKNITVRGESITKENVDYLNSEIQSMNK